MAPSCGREPPRLLPSLLSALLWVTLGLPARSWAERPGPRPIEPEVSADSIAGSSPREVEQIVGRHVAWLNSIQNYRAAIVQRDPTGERSVELFVDHPGERAAVLSPSPDLPEGVFLKTIVSKRRSVRVLLSRRLEGEALPLAARQDLPAGLVAGELNLFRYGDTLERTLRRIYAASPDARAVRGGIPQRAGLSLRLSSDTYWSLASAARELLGAADGQSERELALPREVTVWFGDEGELARVDLVDAGGRESSMSLSYRGFDLPEDAVESFFVGVDAAGPAAGLDALQVGKDLIGGTGVLYAGTALLLIAGALIVRQMRSVDERE